LESLSEDWNSIIVPDGEAGLTSNLKLLVPLSNNMNGMSPGTASLAPGTISIFFGIRNFQHLL
jgi:hypothetical protein